MYRLDFTLRQHTPLIHFQHDQAGASLRATEIKPKLDKFLIKNLFKNDFDVFKKFIVGFSTNSENEYRKDFETKGLPLNFKLLIRSNSGTSMKIGFPKQRRNGEVYWDPQFPCFFGNMGGGEPQKLKQFVHDDDEILCTIVIPDPLLIQYFEESEELFCSFFLKNNFGNRQDKGFGSYAITEFNGRKTDYELSSSLYFECENQHEIPDKFISILDRNGYNTQEKKEWIYNYFSLFESIDLFYRTLRGGINIPGLYFKSLMFFYARALEPKQQWDKKTIRQHFYSEHPLYEQILRRRRDPDGTVNYEPGGSYKSDNFLFRDLLGLASKQSWKYYDEDTISKMAVSNGGDELQRFKSPITFKPVFNDNRFKVYILTDSIPSIYLGAKVEIKSSLFNKEDDPLILKVPDSFPVKSYIKWAVNFYSSNKMHIANKTAEESLEMSVIDNIYHQLYNQITKK